MAVEVIAVMGCVELWDSAPIILIIQDMGPLFDIPNYGGVLINNPIASPSTIVNAGESPQRDDVFSVESRYQRA